MPHKTPWRKKEMKFLMELREYHNEWERVCYHINNIFGNNRTESACRTMYQKLKEK